MGNTLYLPFNSYFPWEAVMIAINMTEDSSTICYKWIGNCLYSLRQWCAIFMCYSNIHIKIGLLWYRFYLKTKLIFFNC